MIIISEAYLKAQSVIQDNADFKVITPIIKIVQRLDIQPLLGTNLYNLILTEAEAYETSATPFTGSNKTLLDDYILPAMVYYILARAPYTMKYRYANKGVVVRNNDNSSAIPKDEMDRLIDENKNIAQQLASDVRLYIIANPSLFPTYFTNNGLDQMLPKNTTYEVDIFIPDNKPTIEQGGRNFGIDVGL